MELNPSNPIEPIKSNPTTRQHVSCGLDRSDTQRDDIYTCLTGR
jgi:hypothetical protein